MKTKLIITLTILLFLALVVPESRSPVGAQAPQPTDVSEAPPDQAPDHRWEEDRNPFAARLYDDRDLEAGLQGIQLPPPEMNVPEQELTAFTAASIVAGYSHTCALSTTGGVKCWGDNSLGKLGDGTTTYRFTPVNVVGLTSGVMAISSLHKHTCVLTTGGGVKCWGYNLHGELGNGTNTDSPVPVDVIGLTSGVAQISAGGFHTCVLTSSGGVKCWGANWHGQVGDGSTHHRNVPVDVTGMTYGVVAIAAGKYHTCALTQSNGVKCWGYNKFGAVGDGTTNEQHLPVNVVGARRDVAGIALGSLHSCLITTSGEAKCWGENSQGQLGDGTRIDRYTPVEVSGLSSGVVALSGGGYSTCGLIAGGGVKCWGDNWAGQDGDGTKSRRKTPVDVIGLGGAVLNVETGDSHACAVTTAGKIKCWGSNAFGQIGDGTSAIRPVPVSVHGLPGGLVGLATGGMHACALTNAGGVKCWGNNAFGQLGDGTIIDRIDPVDVSGLTSGVSAITAGDFHTCALLGTGGVKCWGYNKYGQLGNASDENSYVPVDVINLYGVSAVAAGSNHTCALVGNNPVKCWGDNFNGQLGDGTMVGSLRPVRVYGLNNVVITAIATGENHSCVLTSGGGVKCWGDNAYGEAGDGTDKKRTAPVDVAGLSSGVAEITAGVNHTCALMNNGMAKCWGSNVYGQLGDGTGMQSLVPVDVVNLAGGVTIEAGGFHTCAELNTGTLKCWGDSWTGQLGNGMTGGSLVPVDVSDVSGGVLDLQAGLYFTCILNGAGGVTGEARCWGANGNGQVGDGTIPWVLSPVDVIGLRVVTLTINFPSGKPDSFFTITGSDFQPSSLATVSVNGYGLSPTLSTDGSGGLVFLLSTFNAEEGYYVIKVTADLSISTGLMLAADAPLRAQDGSGPILALPEHIAFTNIAFLPKLGR